MNRQFTDNILSPSSIIASQWTRGQEAALLEPYTYIASLPGKGFRSQLIHALDYWLQVPCAQLEVIVHTIELLHNASLLLDDIEDSSQLRRGKPVAHRIYGVPQTINAANYIYFLALQEITKILDMEQVERKYADSDHHDPALRLRNPSSACRRFIQIFNDEMLALHHGQGLELLWRDYLQCPTEEDYIQMVKDKTGGLLRIAVRLMMECSTVNSDINYVPLVDLLGIWFQIRDDYMNLQSKTYSEQKGFADDLEEGKFSFPIVHGIRSKPDNRFILGVLRQKPKNAALKHHTIAYLKEVTQSFDYTLSVLHSLEAQARAEVTKLGGNPRLDVVLNKLAVSGDS